MSGQTAALIVQRLRTVDRLLAEADKELRAIWKLTYELPEHEPDRAHACAGTYYSGRAMGAIALLRGDVTQALEAYTR